MDNLYPCMNNFIYAELISLYMNNPPPCMNKYFLFMCILWIPHVLVCITYFLPLITPYTNNLLPCILIADVLVWITHVLDSFPWINNSVLCMNNSFYAWITPYMNHSFICMSFVHEIAPKKKQVRPWEDNPDTSGSVLEVGAEFWQLLEEAGI